MKQSSLGIIVLAALAVGFGAGFVLRPVLVPVTAPASPLAAGIAQPTEAEATAAVRRHKVGFTTFSNATLNLGQCSPGTIAPGVTCMTRITLDPALKDAAPQNRAIGFAQVGGQWEVSLW